ncbi:MAG: PAS domain S-box protein [Candidatus Omnitrophica bacterium]|nr:PAS domain S-box protein [Candidatus Omnitrophota bacterium]
MESNSKTPGLILAICVMVTVGLLAWQGWSLFTTLSRGQLAREQSIRVQELRGDLTRLNEILALSVRMAAATGDIQWQVQYDEHRQELEALVEEAMDLASGAYQGDWVEDTEAAARELVNLDRRMLNLVRNGSKVEAQGVLFSEAYTVARQVYADGMRQFDEGMALEARELLGSHHRQILVQAPVTLSLLLLLLALLAIIIVLFRGWRRVTLQRESQLVTEASKLAELNRDLDKKVQELDRQISEQKAQLEVRNLPPPQERVIMERITEHKQTDEHFRLAVESSPSGMVMINEEGQMVLVNSEAEKLFGYRRDELLGRPVEILVPEASRGKHPEFVRKYFEEPNTVVMGLRRELAGQRKDGSCFPAEIGLNPIRTSEGLFVLSSVIDITERKQAEEELQRAHEELKKSHDELKATQLQLIRAAKMESIGRLAAGVAHEVKNPLMTLIIGIKYLAQHLKSQSADVITLLGDMDDSVQRADRIVKGLLDFSAPVQLEITVEDINSAIEEALRLMKHELDKEQITVEKDLAYPLPPIRIDINKIQQVLINIITNAAHSMKGGGKLTVRTQLLDLEAGDDIVGRRKDDPFRVGDTVVKIEVADTGRGISQDKLEKIFDPFFTTKAAGEGTGLGLSVVRQIVEMHKGVIKIENRATGGVVVTIVLRTE